MTLYRMIGSSLVGLLIALSGCVRGSSGESSGTGGGGPAEQVADTVPARGRGMMGGGGMMGGMMGRSADTATAPTARAATASAPGCPDVSQALVDTGREIFTGRGGTCFACHGSDAHGTTLAPDLADSTWLDADGSYAGIVQTVRSGVARPKKYPAPMPPMGGAQLGTDQVCAVAAYVYSLSHESDSTAR